MQNNVFLAATENALLSATWTQFHISKKDQTAKQHSHHPLGLHCDRRGHSMATEIEFHPLAALPSHPQAGCTARRGLQPRVAQGAQPGTGTITLPRVPHPHKTLSHGSSAPGISPNISLQALLWRASTQLLLKIDLGHLLL